MEISILKVIDICNAAQVTPFAMFANEFGIVLQFDNTFTIQKIFDLQFAIIDKGLNAKIEFGTNYTEIYLNFYNYG